MALDARNKPETSLGVRGYLVEGLIGFAIRFWSNKCFFAGLQIAVGLFLITFGLWIGREHCRLVLFGVRSYGKLVSYQPQRLNIVDTNGSTFSDTAFMPAVEFQAQGRVFQFRDWMASRFRVPMGGTVPILYDPARPTSAMIDRPVANWIPWAPLVAVGVLLAISGIRTRLRLSREPAA